jgi:integrin beta 3
MGNVDPVALADAVTATIKLALAPMLARLAVLEAQVAQGPRDGRDGLPGAPGPAGMPGEKGLDGAQGREGRDGVDGTPGRDGVDGAPGRDGTLEQLRPEYDGERTVTFRREGSPDPLLVCRMPVVLDRGVYQAGQAYEPGDGASWAGSFWIAQRATSEKPGDGDTGWRLAVKRGSEGKPGPRGETGEKGLKGDPGPDGRVYR